MLYDLVIVLVVLVGALSIAAGLTWFERRLLGFFQDRLGPNRVGPAGLLQPLADTVKMFTKEDWIPPFADGALFILAPAIIIVSVLLAFVVVPVSRTFVVADMNIGLLFFLAMSSLGVYSVVLAGWSSASKYSVIGGLRAAAQMMSYEVFMGIALTGVVLLAGSFDLNRIVEGQRGLWYVVPAVPRLHRLPAGRLRRDAPHPVRPGRSRKRARGRLSHRVLRHEVRHSSWSASTWA